LLAETVNDGRKILTEHLPELAFYFSLDKILDDGDGVERAIDVDILQRIGLEDEGNAFLLGDDKDDIRTEFEMR
jgi:hypothetical protein